MFRIRYIFILLNFFVLGFDCYYIFKNSDNGMQMMPEEFKMVYNQIADPLKRLAEMLPDHNVEVQLEMLGNDRVPIRTTRLSFIHYQKPVHDIRLREYDPDRENSSPESHVKSHTTTTMQLPPSPTATQVPQVPQVPQVQYQQQQVQQIQPYVFTLPPGFNQVQPSYQRLNRYDRFNPAIFIRQQKEKGAEPNSKNENENENANPPANEEANSQPQTPENSTGPQADETQERKPLYMADLKKALEEFEKKFFAKQNENKVLPEAAQGGAVEEAKRPLLKKDLWMAMGLKFMTGCPNAHEYLVQNHETSAVPVGTTKRLIKIMGPESEAAPYDQINPKVNRIMNLLKAGVKVDRFKPNEANLQWLQVKIPKRQ